MITDDHIPVNEKAKIPTVDGKKSSENYSRSTDFSVLLFICVDLSA